MEAMSFVLFGATGDLAKRKIFPALYNLFLDGKTPKSFSVIGIGKNELNELEFQSLIKESVHEFSRRSHSYVEEAKMVEFLKIFRYFSMDLTNALSYQELFRLVIQREEELDIGENRMFYFSIAPQFFETAAMNIYESGLGNGCGWKRLLIEKPFGHDLKSARILNAKLRSVFKEEEIYRIDHYLGKPMVQNLESLEFANPVLQSLWNNKHIANVQITASETVGVEERADYYESAGAIRDMVQNHMLQLVMMTTMRIPDQINSENIRVEKKKVLQSLRPIIKEDVQKDVVRGQYSSGLIQNRCVGGYLAERGVSRTSDNDTFFAARLQIDNEDWKGVPFYIRTGKRMKEKSTRIVLEFKNPIKKLYQTVNMEAAPNLLIIDIQPRARISIKLNIKNTLNEGVLEQAAAYYSPDELDVPEAYELLLNDAMRGISTYFAHWEEVELAWKWVQPLLDAFQEKTVPLSYYTSGTMGPDESNHLVREDGFKWW